MEPDENTSIDWIGWACVAIIIGVMVALWAIVVYDPAHANPFTCDDAANTCTYRITATEPTKTKQGLALTNYKQTNIKTQLNGGPVAILVKPATAPTGGGTVTYDITFATVAGAKTQLDVRVSGTNTMGIEGAEATAVGSPVVKDRTLDPLGAPLAPTATVN